MTIRTGLRARIFSGFLAFMVLIPAFNMQGMNFAGGARMPGQQGRTYTAQEREHLQHQREKEEFYLRLFINGYRTMLSHGIKPALSQVQDTIVTDLVTRSVLKYTPARKLVGKNIGIGNWKVNGSVLVSLGMSGIRQAVKYRAELKQKYGMAWPLAYVGYHWAPFVAKSVVRGCIKAGIFSHLYANPYVQRAQNWSMESWWKYELFNEATMQVNTVIDSAIDFVADTTTNAVKSAVKVAVS